MGKAIKVKWTPERMELLRRKYRTGEPMEAIAREFECSVKAIYCTAHRLGLRRPYIDIPTRKYTMDQFEFVRKHYPDMSNRTLSLVSGVGMAAIWGWRARHGWLKSERYKAECKEYTRKKDAVSRWRKAHPEKVREYQRRCRERQRAKTVISKSKPDKHNA